MIISENFEAMNPTGIAITNIPIIAKTQPTNLPPKVTGTLSPYPILIKKKIYNWLKCYFKL